MFAVVTQDFDPVQTTINIFQSPCCKITVKTFIDVHEIKIVNILKVAFMSLQLVSKQARKKISHDQCSNSKTIDLSDITLITAVAIP